MFCRNQPEKGNHPLEFRQAEDLLIYRTIGLPDGPLDSCQLIDSLPELVQQDPGVIIERLQHRPAVLLLDLCSEPVDLGCQPVFNFECLIQFHNG